MVNQLPWTAAAALLVSVPCALHLLTFAKNNHKEAENIRQLKLIALKFHSYFGIALAVGLAAFRWTV